MPDYSPLIELAIALGIGLMIGVERGWTQRDKPDSGRMAGLRTFTVTGLFGGVAAALATTYGVWIIVAMGALVGLIVAAALVRIPFEAGNHGITTEIALILTFALGALAGSGREEIAVPAAVVVTMLLAFKPPLHRWVENLEQPEIYGAVRLLVMSLVVLPILPNEGFGPWAALNPYVIWLMVVLISALSFAGYMAVKYAGARWGLIVTGLMGGLASSTAVAVTMARLGKGGGAVQPSAATAAVASSTVVYVRLLVVSAAFAPVLAWKLAPVLGAMALTGAVCVAIMWPRETAAGGGGQQAMDDMKPFSLATPLRFAAILAVVMVASAGLQTWLGDAGLLLVSAVAGLTDVDAPSLTAAERVAGGMEASVGALAILAAVAVNIVTKFVIVASIGGASMARRVAPGLLLALPVGVAVWWFVAH
ncbi:MgtC/SapB family protein [Emcibacter sp. SYSU 3D8]|uniref:MgtC/SapB family protein n=1 Tax=Emcibacter sp. SYSU 3D8 TaxID=3133969 RepID=UPI0031FF38B1